MRLAIFLALLRTAQTFNSNHTDEFVQNQLVSEPYETLPLTRAKAARIPGYTGFVPGSMDVVGQRRAQATLHTVGAALERARGRAGEPMGRRACRVSKILAMCMRLCPVRVLHGRMRHVPPFHMALPPRPLGAPQSQLMPMLYSSRGAYQSMELVDLRPQVRASRRPYGQHASFLCTAGWLHGHTNMRQTRPSSKRTHLPW